LIRLFSVFSVTFVECMFVQVQSLLSWWFLMHVVLFALSFWLWMFLSLASQKSQGGCTTPLLVMLMMPPNVTGPCSLDQKFLTMSILWVLGRPAYGISSSRYNANESCFVSYLNISIWSLWSCINYQLCCIYNRWMTHQSMILITCYLNRRHVDNWESETVLHEIETSYAYTKNGLLVHICYIYNDNYLFYCLVWDIFL